MGVDGALTFILNSTCSTDPAASVAAAAVASGRAEICAASVPNLLAGTDMVVLNLGIVDGHTAVASEKGGECVA